MTRAPTMVLTNILVFSLCEQFNHNFIFWCIMVTNSGIARGSGWQKAGAFVYLGSCYLVGIPAAIVFAFVLHTGVKVIKKWCILLQKKNYYHMISFHSTWYFK